MNSYIQYKLEGRIKASRFDEDAEGYVITRDGLNSVVRYETIRIHLSSLKRNLTPELVALELGLNPEEFEYLKFYRY